jgi:hypothetical protein
MKLPNPAGSCSRMVVGSVLGLLVICAAGSIPLVQAQIPGSGTDTKVEAVQPRPKYVRWLTETNGIKLGIELASFSQEAPSCLQGFLVVSNSSANTLDVARPMRPGDSVVVDLRDADGRLLACRSGFEKLRLPYGLPIKVGSRFYHEFGSTYLRMGEEQWFPFPISKAFRIKKAGEYLLSVQLRFYCWPKEHVGVAQPYVLPGVRTKVVIDDDMLE